MARKSSIIAEIDQKIGITRADLWRIGITNDASARRNYWRDVEKQNICYWSHWAADTPSDAELVEAHFVKKGMKGGARDRHLAGKSVYIYVF